MAVSLDLARQHLRVTHTRENDLIETYLKAAKAWVENFTGKKLARGSVEQREEAFGSYVPLLWGPSPESVSVAYVGASGAANALVATPARASLTGVGPPGPREPMV